MDIKKYTGIIPAFYAAYDANGEISPEGVEALATYGRGHQNPREEGISLYGDTKGVFVQ